MVRVGASMGQWRLAPAGWPLRHRRPRDGAPICAVGWLRATKQWSQKLGCLSFRREPGGHGCRGQEQGLHPSILLQQCVPRQAGRACLSRRAVCLGSCQVQKPDPIQAGGEVGCGLRTILRFWRRSWLWTHFLFRLGWGILLRPLLSSCWRGPAEVRRHPAMDSAGWMKFELAVAQIRFTEIAHTYTHVIHDM